MSLPFFYIDAFDAANAHFTLSEDNSRHVISVLRMHPGEAIHLTDGKGTLITAVITDPHKKKCGVSVTETIHTPAPAHRTGIGISLLKNHVRFEWFLEKATEIGITDIYPLLCERTEKQNFREERMKNVLVSALIQSRQTWLPRMVQPLPVQPLISGCDFAEKRIAHCLPGEKQSLTRSNKDQLALIGPEGDFSASEIDLASQQGFLPVSLGNTRLRSETAGMVAAVLLTQR